MNRVRSDRLVVALLSLLLVPPASASGSAARPNIILIMADDLGYGDISPYGNASPMPSTKPYAIAKRHFVHTPNLLRLARDGKKYTNFYAYPFCSASRATMMSGQYAPRLGMLYNCEQPSARRLPEDVQLLSHLMQGAGYRTYHVGKWHLGHVELDGQHPQIKDTHNPVRRGYDEFHGYLFGSLGNYRNPLLYDHRASDPLEQPLAPAEVRPGYVSDRLGDKVVEHILAHEGRPEPFFINYWDMAPHGPQVRKGVPQARADDDPTTPEIEDDMGRYSSKPGFRPDSVPFNYLAQITGLDRQVGKILAALSNTNQAADTLIIFTSDNGRSAKVQLGAVPDAKDPNVRYDHRSRYDRVLRGSKGSVYEGGIKVPFIVHWPGRVPPGLANTQVVGLVDMLPTMARLAGVPVGPGTDHPIVDGVDISATFTADESAPAPLPARTLYWEVYGHDRRQVALRRERWKYIVLRDAGNRDVAVEMLFKLPVRYNPDTVGTTEDEADNRMPTALAHPASEAARQLAGLRLEYRQFRRVTRRIENNAPDVVVFRNEDGSVHTGAWFAFSPASEPPHRRVMLHHNTRFNPDRFDLTVAGWLRSSGTTGKAQYIIGKGNDWKLVLAADRSSLQLRWKDDAGGAHVIAHPLTAAELREDVHYAVNFIGGNRKTSPRAELYVNGRRVQSLVYRGRFVRSNTKPVSIGNSGKLAHPFNGRISRPTFYSASLLPAGVHGLYRAGVPPTRMDDTAPAGPAQPEERSTNR